MSQTRTVRPQKTGLPYWMDRVLEQLTEVGAEFSPQAVHDLRVALRRCILIAEAMRKVDPSSDWKSMRKSARRVFQSLGALRDAHVLTEWVEKLRSLDTNFADSLLMVLRTRHEKGRSDAQAAIEAFDRRPWRTWTKELSSHYRHTAANRPVCESLVFETWESLLDLHRLAQKRRSRVAYHRLRGGFKDFRYAVENFLPSMHRGWISDVKYLQDLLGEVHDLGILEEIIAKRRTNSDEPGPALWLTKLRQEQASRIQQYRAKTAGKSSPLWTWQEGLPAERELRSAGLARLTEWAYFLTPDPSRVRRIDRLSLQLYDGLLNRRVFAIDLKLQPHSEPRFILHTAALLQEVGRFKKSKAHHKKSFRMIRDMQPPPGWSEKDLELAAVIARFHRRALPRPDHKSFKKYDIQVRNSLVLLAAILRFANALDAKPYRAVRRLDVEDSSGVVVVRADGFTDREPLSQKLAVARRLLEFSCQRPVEILSPGMRLAPQTSIHPAVHSDAA